MSYNYRRDKRNLCHYILNELDFSAMEERDFDEEEPQQNKWPLVYEFIYKHKEYNRDQIVAALRLLEYNKHILLSDTPDISKPEYSNIEPTAEGKEAYFEGFYDKEKRKD